MNVKFAEAVTEAAFQLTLTKAQIEALNSLIMPDNSLTALRFGYTKRTLFVLYNKGLVEQDKERNWHPTLEGKYVIKLLLLSGLIVQDKRKLLPPKFMREFQAEIEACREELTQ